MRQGRPPCHQYFESSVQNLVVKRSTALEKKTRVRVVAASGSRFRAPMNALACCSLHDHDSPTRTIVTATMYLSLFSLGWYCHALASANTTSALQREWS